jgi:hypothetical protein
VLSSDLATKAPAVAGAFVCGLSSGRPSVLAANRSRISLCENDHRLMPTDRPAIVNALTYKLDHLQLRCQIDDISAHMRDTFWYYWFVTQEISRLARPELAVINLSFKDRR